MVRRAYLGMDESNHNCDPEIIAAFLSFERRDGHVYRAFGRHRFGADEMGEFMKNEEVERYCGVLVVPRPLLHFQEHPPVTGAPIFINDFLEQGVKANDVKVMFDGAIQNKKSFFPHLDRSLRVGVECFPKVKRGEDKRYPYSDVLNLADSLAHQSFKLLGRSFDVPDRDHAYLIRGLPWEGGADGFAHKVTF